jgi:hypothetical protein
MCLARTSRLLGIAVLTAVEVAFLRRVALMSGPAVLAVNPKLYGYLRLYLDMLRIIPGYNLDDERSIFTSWPKTDGTVALMNDTEHIQIES